MIKKVLLCVTLTLGVISNVMSDSLTVTSPTSGEQVVQGSDFAIEWIHAIGDSIGLVIAKEGDTVAVIDSAAPNSNYLQTQAKWLWGLGAGFQIWVIDDNDRIGKSDTFSIVETDVILPAPGISREALGEF